MTGRPISRQNLEPARRARDLARIGRAPDREIVQQPARLGDRRKPGREAPQPSPCSRSRWHPSILASAAARQGAPTPAPHISRSSHSSCPLTGRSRAHPTRRAGTSPQSREAPSAGPPTDDRAVPSTSPQPRPQARLQDRPRAPQGRPGPPPSSWQPLASPAVVSAAPWPLGGPLWGLHRAFRHTLVTGRDGERRAPCPRPVAPSAPRFRAGFPLGVIRRPRRRPGAGEGYGLALKPGNICIGDSATLAGRTSPSIPCASGYPFGLPRAQLLVAPLVGRAGLPRLAQLHCRPRRLSSEPPWRMAMTLPLGSVSLYRPCHVAKLAVGHERFAPHGRDLGVDHHGVEDGQRRHVPVRRSAP